MWALWISALKKFLASGWREVGAGDDATALVPSQYNQVGAEGNGSLQRHSQANGHSTASNLATMQPATASPAKGGADPQIHKPDGGTADGGSPKEQFRKGSKMVDTTPVEVCEKTT
jgi:hypothetical protein